MVTVQAAVALFEAAVVGRLGAEALAGLSVVFPLVMLMQTMSAGGMGGGVAAAVARTLGAGRREDADRLVVHALVIALVMAALFTAGLLLGGAALYAALGARGGALAAALTYSRVIFGGAAATWTLSTLASVVRGTGNMVLPAVVVVGGSALAAGLMPALVLGAGPLPSLGVAGAAAAMVLTQSLGAAVLLAYLASGRGPVRLSLRGLRLRADLFADILRVGAPSLVNNVLTNVAIVLLTGLVGSFGTRALAGYGVGARLEYLLIPIAFGVGSALVAVVGTNVGAGQLTRATRAAWAGAALAGGLTGAIGLAAALFPRPWLALFSADPEVLAVGTAYLRIVGPAYGCFGVGFALYFASQGAGRLLWPLVASVARLVVAAGGGWIALRVAGGGLDALFGCMAAALVVLGAINAAAVRGGAWRRPAR